MRHARIQGIYGRNTTLVALCGARVETGELVDFVVRETGGGYGELVEDLVPLDCPTCVVREAAQRMGARWGICGACESTGRVARRDSAITTCMNCGGEGLYQVPNPWRGDAR